MILAAQRLRKSFVQGQKTIEVLSDVNFELGRGETVAIVGTSGSGKSSLLAILAGFLRPDGGDVLWNGASSNQWTEKKWSEFRKKNLGFVFQNYQLIPYLTALENASLPLKLLKIQNANETTSTLLNQLGLLERQNHLPSQLSGGESQRVAIARAIIHSPELILADEPTGSLDESTGSQVLDLFFATLKEKSLSALVVTHSPEVAKRCDRVLTLHKGVLC